MNNFKQRVITGIMFGIIMVCAVVFSKFIFISLFYVINLIGLSEFYRLVNSSPTTFRKVSGFVLSSSVFLTTVLVILNFCDYKILVINLAIGFMIFVWELYLKSENPFLNVAMTFLGIIYVTIPCLFIIGLPFLPFVQKIFHSYFMLGYLNLVWANDTGAYVFGKLFGKHFLFERISPKKTWEGSIGGACCTISVAYLVSLLYKEITISDWIIIASIVIVIGTYGDLIKSLLKRSVHVKDSGTILPGHGGILDRFDSMFSSAPFVFSYLFISI